MKFEASLNAWCGVWNRGPSARMISWLLVLTQRSRSEIAEPIFLTLWCHHSAVWERKENIVTVVESQFLGRTATKTTQISMSFITLDPGKEHWLNVWSCIYSISWDTEINFVRVVSSAIKIEENWDLRNFPSVGKRLLKVIEHYYGGDMSWKPLFSIWGRMEQRLLLLIFVLGDWSSTNIFGSWWQQCNWTSGGKRLISHPPQKHFLWLEPSYKNFNFTSFVFIVIAHTRIMILAC